MSKFTLLTTILLLFHSFVTSHDFFLILKTDVPSSSAITIGINSSLAPLGAAHLKTVVSSGYYDNSAFFRVVPNFVVQFGISTNVAQNDAQTPIVDDPVIGSNTKGTITYATAGPNTRTTQLFVNLKDNASLDTQGFAPFGTVLAGFDVFERVVNPTPSDSGGISQSHLETGGAAWLDAHYPAANRIVSATWTATNPLEEEEEVEEGEGGKEIVTTSSPTPAPTPTPTPTSSSSSTTFLVLTLVSVLLITLFYNFKNRRNQQSEEQDDIELMMDNISMMDEDDEDLEGEFDNPFSPSYRNKDDILD